MKAIASARRLTLLAAILFAPHTAPALAVPTQTSNESAQALPLAKPIWIKQRTRGYDVNIRYPKVAKSANAARINTMLKRLIEEQVADYRKGNVYTWHKGTPRGRLVGNYQVASCSPQL